MSWPSSERKKLRIRKRSIDLEMESPARKENARTTTPELRVSTMTSTRPRRELTNWLNSLTPRTLSSEELMKLLTLLHLNTPEPRMTTLDSWSRHKLSKEISMDNLLKRQTSRELPRMKMQDAVNSNLKPSKGRLD